MIWIISIVVIIAISLYLAFRSMKDYQEVPISNITYSLYLIRNKQQFNLPIVNNLYKETEKLNAHFSFEVITKGEEQVHLLWMPIVLKNNFATLDLIELEDYLSLSGVDSSIAFVGYLKDKKNPLGLNNLAESVKGLNLTPEQRISLQMVCLPLEKNSFHFQVTLRVIIVDRDPNSRIELSKKLQDIFHSSGKLVLDRKEETTAKIFNDYLKRSYVPPQVQAFTLTAEEIMSLLS